MTDIEKLIKLLEHAESFSLEAYGKSPNLSECSLNIQYLRACILQAIDNAKALRERLAPEQEPAAWVYSEGLAALKAGKCWTAYGTKQDKDNSIPLYTAPQQRKPLTDEEKLIDLLEAARETFKKSPSGSECSQNAAYVHSVLETMLIKREWQGLTNEEVGALTVFDGLHHVEIPILANFVWAVEAKLKEKNT